MAALRKVALSICLGYRAKRSLLKHMANVHPEPGQDIPRKNCNVPGCGATFVWADSLRLHTKNKHPGTKHLMLPDVR